MRQHSLFQRGMTLLEIMLVLSLIGVLSAVAVPSYNGYLERANEGRAIGDIGTISIELYRWQMHNGVFPPDLATAGLDGFVDPWGNPYAYLNIDAGEATDVRKGENLRPLNTDFDLYSTGPDGDSRLALTAQVSRDDVVRANNGGYIGRAEDY